MRVNTIARVLVSGKPPVTLQAQFPEPSPAQIRVKVLAVGISPQVRERTSFDHPAIVRQNDPIDPSMDGVVLEEETGDKFYVFPRGAQLLAEYTTVHTVDLLRIPDTFDPVKIAGLSGTWLFCWAMLVFCFRRRVMIVGADSCYGRAAAHIARILGAAAIIGIDTDEAALATIPELTERHVLQEPRELPLWENIHIVLDFVGKQVGLKVMHHINNTTRTLAQYFPAWGPRGSELFAIDDDMVAKRVRLVDPALASWRLFASPLMRQKLRYAFQWMAEMHQTPFEIVSKPMSEMFNAWDEEDFAKSKKMLVIIPGPVNNIVPLSEAVSTETAASHVPPPIPLDFLAILQAAGLSEAYYNGTATDI